MNQREPSWTGLLVPDHWKRIPLHELYEYRSGLSKPRSEFGSGHPFLSFKDVFYNTFVPETLTELVNSTVREREACSIRRGDVFLTRTSETLDELGMSCVALRDYDTATFNGFCKRLRPKPGTEIEPEYAAYYFRSPWFRRAVTAMSTMSTRASLNSAMLNRLEVLLPPPPIQVAIGSLLKTIDDKIELNRRMNETLERMVQTLFQSWFVDYDPVQKKVHGKRPHGLDEATAALFPSAFQPSSLGPIPRTWEVKRLESVTALIRRGFQPRYADDGTLVINQKCIRHGRVNYSLARRHDPTKRATGRHELEALDTLVNSTGVGTLGRVSMVPESAPTAICDSHVTVVRADSATSTGPWLFAQLSTLQPQLEHMGEGSTGQTELARSKLAGLALVCPPLALQRAFDDACLPLFQMIWANERESIHLAATRDTLLPKLLPGETRSSSQAPFNTLSAGLDGAPLGPRSPNNPE